MGYYTQIHVLMGCDYNEGVAKEAKNYLESHKELSWDASAYLNALSTRTGGNPGPKGGVSQWGMVGNYTNLETFVEELKDFWKGLLTKSIDGAPLNFEHILVLYEAEQAEATTVVEIYLSEDAEENIDEEDLIIKWYPNMPFKFNQF